MKTRFEKIKFIIWFTIIYTVFLAFGLSLLGKFLLKIDEEVIKFLFGNIINYNSFIFVSECSGIVSISAYLAIVLGLIITKYKMSWKWIIGSIVILWAWNIIRILIVVISEKASFALAQILHIVFWFITGIIIVLLAIKSLKKSKK